MKLLIATLAMFCSTLVLAGPPASRQQRNVDLRTPHALEHLRNSDPAAYEQIEKIMTGLREKPNRAEGDWLKVNFNARDVNFSRLVFRTSLPPVQLLTFTLRDARYTMYVVRTDVTGRAQPVH